MSGTWVSKTPVVVDVPEARVNRVDGSEGDENSAVCVGFIDTIDTECHVEYDGCHVFAHVEQMREGVSCIMVAAKALYCSPYAREGGEEPKQSRV